MSAILIVYQKTNNCLNHLLVVHLSKGSISFLAGGVPHFELDNVLIKLDILSHEAATNGRFMCLAELA